MSRANPTMPTIRRIFYLAMAAIFFGLGVLGVLLPLIPATPFLLLTSYFLARASPRLNAVLLNSRLFGPLLHDWQVRGGVRPDVRLKAITIVIVAVLITLFLIDFAPIQSALVSTVALIGVIVILQLPRAKM
jgi:uncharacterized membrane protein YbaN (DUF454 family)